MRLSTLLSAAIVVAATFVTAWSKEDHEIFRVREEIERYEGEGSTFYDLIGVKNGPSASRDDIQKAFRKISKRLHPDKLNKPAEPGSKLTKRDIAEQERLAHERYARLTLVNNILRGPERERYDHFLKNGFPRWKGTGYYYARFRPGLGSVLVGLFIFIGGFGHYSYLWLSMTQKRRFFENFIREARVSAWGNINIPSIANIGNATESTASAVTASANGPINRRDRRMAKNSRGKQNRGGIADGDDSGSGASTPIPQVLGSAGQGRRKIVAGNGKVLIVNATGEVYLVEEDPETGEEIELKLDLDDIEKPKLRDTAIIRLPLWLFGSTLGRVLGKRKKEAAEGVEGVEGGERGEEVVSDEAEGGDVTRVEAPVKKTRKSTKAGVPQQVEKASGLPRRKVRSK